MDSVLLQPLRLVILLDPFGSQLLLSDVFRSCFSISTSSSFLMVTFIRHDVLQPHSMMLPLPYGIKFSAAKPNVDPYSRSEYEASSPFGSVGSGGSASSSLRNHSARLGPVSPASAFVLMIPTESVCFLGTFGILGVGPEPDR